MPLFDFSGMLLKPTCYYFLVAGGTSPATQITLGLAISLRALHQQYLMGFLPGYCYSWILFWCWQNVFKQGKMRQIEVSRREAYSLRHFELGSQGCHATGISIRRVVYFYKILIWLDFAAGEGDQKPSKQHFAPYCSTFFLNLVIQHACTPTAESGVGILLQISSQQ